MTPSPDAPRLHVERDGRVLTLTIDNPAARNALAPDMYREGAQALREAAADPDVGAVLLAGRGTDFCAGGNLQRLQANRERPRATQRAAIEGLHDWVRALRDCPRPVIAAVEGAAAGAGCSLVLACDLIVAADDARFVMAYVRVGLSPDGGGTWTLPRLLSHQVAMEMLLEGGSLPAARLHALGVVNALVPAGQALAAARERAARLADGPLSTIARIKRLARDGQVASLDDHLDAERDSFVESLHAPEAGEGIAAFLGKRPPRWHG